MLSWNGTHCGAWVCRTMRLSLRFVVPLFLALGIFAYAALPLVDKLDRKSTRLNSSHDQISYAVFCLKKKNAFLLRLTSSTVAAHFSTDRYSFLVCTPNSP